jgi:AraC-like DNA-binding protein
MRAAVALRMDEREPLSALQFRENWPVSEPRPRQVDEVGLCAGRSSRAAPARERGAEVSIRLLWPFARLLSARPGLAATLARSGISPAQFADPEMRVSRRLAVELLEETVLATGMPELGLRAGERTEAGEFDVLERVAQSATTLGAALDHMARYMRILHDSLEITVENDGEYAAICCRVTDGAPQSAASNDFLLATAVTFLKRIPRYEAPVEIRFAHPAPSYIAKYRRIFETKLRFGARCNAVVLRRERLAEPMLRASPHAAAAFALQADHILRELRRRDTIEWRVRTTVAARLEAGTVDMQSTAQTLGMSVATLRRRLLAEGVSFAGVVDDLRRQLAEGYLREGAITGREIARLLGFSSAPAFHRAFRRWTGSAPSECRSRARCT